MVCNEKICIQDGYSYLFIKNELNFQEAKQKCRMANGILLQNLDRDSILKLETCCFFNKTARAYWVGLERADDCTNPSLPYRFADNSECVSDLKTSVSTLGSRSNCTALALFPAQKADTHAGMREQPCSQRSSYACQFVAKTLLSTTTTTSTILSTFFSSTDDHTPSPTSSTTTPVPTTVDTSTEFAHFITDTTPFLKNKKKLYENLFYIGAATIFTFFLVAALVYFSLTKCCKNEKIKRRNLSDESSTETVNVGNSMERTYCSIKNPETQATTYSIDRPSTSSLSANLLSHYEKPNVPTARRPLPQPQESYIYVELDDPMLSIGTETSSGVFEDPDDPEDADDYIVMNRVDQNNIQEAETQSVNGYLQPVHLRNLPSAPPTPQDKEVKRPEVP